MLAIMHLVFALMPHDLIPVDPVPFDSIPVTWVSVPIGTFSYLVSYQLLRAWRQVPGAE